MQLRVNGKLETVDDARVAPEMPLLWLLRDVLHLTGTKYGCGIAACGACTVHVDDRAARSCVTPLSAVTGKSIRTIEGLAESVAGPDGTRVDKLHAVQQAWIAHQVPQCGYCQSGMLMAAAALLAAKAKPSETEIDAAMSNLCRCGTYPRVRVALQSLIKAAPGKAGTK